MAKNKSNQVLDRMKFGREHRQPKNNEQFTQRQPHSPMDTELVANNLGHPRRDEHRRPHVVAGLTRCGGALRAVCFEGGIMAIVILGK